jgi:hypothetical protein
MGMARLTEVGGLDSAPVYVAGDYTDDGEVRTGVRDSLSAWLFHAPVVSK